MAVPKQQPADRDRHQPLDRDPRRRRRDAWTGAQGRVLDPATAIEVDGVLPRPTVYVGPRLTISKAIDVGEALQVLRAVAGRWAGPSSSEEEERTAAAPRRPRRPGPGARRRRSPPTGGPCSSRRGSSSGSKGRRGRPGPPGLQRGRRLEPVASPTPSTPRTRSTLQPVRLQQPAGLGPSGGEATVSRAAGGRQPVAYVGPRPYAVRELRRAGDPWWRSSTPAAASTPGSTARSRRGSTPATASRSGTRTR